MKQVKYLAKLGLYTSSLFVLMGSAAHASSKPDFDQKIIKKISNFSYVTARGGDKLNDVAERYDVLPRDLVKWNKILSPFKLSEGQRLKIMNPKFHHAKTGENINDIADKYNSTAREIAVLNHIKTSDKIISGDRIRIPDSIEKIAVNTVKENKIAETKTIDKKKVNQVVFGKSTKSRVQNQMVELKKPKALIAKIEKKTEQKIVVKLKAEEKKVNIVQAKSNQKVKKLESKKKILDGAEFAVYNIQEKPGRFLAPISFTASKAEVISAFGTKRGGIVNDGINIAAPIGQTVRAAASGNVVYVGDHLKGYGNLVIIKHTGNYFTAYAQLGDYAVRKGQKVKIGQRIGTVGASGNVERPQLHFAIRKGKESINPSKIFRKG
jgi:murein DD-endopeptidase MepM/ murein hydrolase activator NlpD